MGWTGYFPSLGGSLGTRASLLGEKSGSPRGMAKVGGNVGCRVPATRITDYIPE